MLKLHINDADIYRVCKLLVKYNVDATISNNLITLDGDISDELSTKLCDIIEVDYIQNFISNKPVILQEELPTKTHYTFIKNSHTQLATPRDGNSLDRNCNYGEIYMCDFGEPYAHEQGFIRPAIVVQNHKSYFNYYTTIVVPCTSKSKKPREGEYSFILSPDTMVDYELKRVGSKKNTTVLTEKIREVDKCRLLRYMGTLKPEIMQDIQDRINLVVGKFPYPKNYLGEKS